MPEKYDPVASGNVVVKRCFERHYVFFFPGAIVEDMPVLANKIGLLTNGNIIGMHVGEFGGDKKLGLRVTIEVEIECPDDPDLEMPGPDHEFLPLTAQIFRKE